jgi:hypothetical protein
MEKLNNCHISNVIAAGRHFGPLSQHSAIAKRNRTLLKKLSRGQYDFPALSTIDINGCPLFVETEAKY